MATVLDSIDQALREIGVLASSETATAQDANDGFAALNRMLDQWAAERLQIYVVTRTLWTIAASTQDYTVGTGATVNVARPVFLDHVNFVDTSTSPDTEYPMSPLTDDAYAGIVLKALTSPLPAAWYYKPTFPTGTLSLFPIPTSSTLQGALYAPQQIGAFTALTDTVTFPPGYSELLITNLAVNLASSYSRQVDPSLAMRAMNAKSIVKRSNSKLMDLSFPAGALIGNGGYGWSIRTGP